MTKSIKSRETPEPIRPLRLLSDEPIAGYWRDGLEIDQFARVVAGAALGTTGPFTIGVYGDWGQGNRTAVTEEAVKVLRGERQGLEILGF